MGLTKDYLRYLPAGICNVVGSSNGLVQCVDDTTCAVAACENINFFNMRTLELTHQISNTNKSVTTFKMNNDKSLIAVGYQDGEVKLYRRSQEKEAITFAGHRTGVNCLAFSEDGLVLASGGKDSMIILWDVVSETGMFKLIGHKGSVTQIQFTQDNKYLLSSSKDFQIKFWSVDSQSCFYTLAENVTEIYTFALIKNDRLLVVGSAELELLVFELSWLEKDAELSEPIEQSNSKKSREDTECLTGANFIGEQCSQGNIIVKCKKRGSLVRQAKGRALQLCLSNDGVVLCCVGGDSLVDVYRIFTMEESQKRFQKKLRKEKRKVEEDSAESSFFEENISKDVTLLITRIGDYRSQSKVKWIDFCKKTISVTEQNVFEYRLFCLLNSNDVHGVSLKINKKSNETIGNSIVGLSRRGHRSDVLSLCVAANGASFISGATESAILWDFNSLLPINCLTNDSMKQITACLFAPGDKEAIFCTKDGCIFVFNISECELIEEHIKIHEGVIWSAVTLHNNLGLVTCGRDKKARFWKYETLNNFGRNRLSLKLDRILDLPDEALCAAAAPSGKYYAFGLLDNTARIYYSDTLKFFVSLYGHSLPIFCISISPDSRLIITGSGDKTIKIWGSDFGDCHKSLFAHDDSVMFAKFGDGVEEKLFWSAGKDGKIKQWDAVKFDRIQTLEGHTEEIRALASTQDGSTIITAAHDKSIRLWELSDEIIVLQEEEEKEREKQYDEKLVDEEDIVPGEANDREIDLAPIKNVESIKSTETILESIDIVRNELLERENNPGHVPHILLANYTGTNSLDIFVLDSLQSIRSSHLEKSLQMVPLSYVPDIVKSLCKCAQQHLRSEFVCRVILFLVKIHHNQIINSAELLPILDELRTALPKEVTSILDQIGFNLAALRFFQMQLEERDNLKLFRDVSLVENEKTKRNKKKSKKVKDVAFIRQ